MTLGLLTDDRLEKRKMGKEFILQARIDQPKIKGVRYFTQNLTINGVNYEADDYSNFILYNKLSYFTEPTVTMHLTTQDLDNVVEGKSSLVELCGLQKIPCHTQVILKAPVFVCD